jgi:hypothetical protein
MPQESVAKALTNLFKEIDETKKTIYEVIVQLEDRLRDACIEYTRNQTTWHQEEKELLEALLPLVQKPTHPTRWKGFWIEVPGQLRPGERISERHDDKEVAKARAQSTRDAGVVEYAEVRQLRISENDRSTDDPKYDASQSVVNTYWCVVVKSRIK